MMLSYNQGNQVQQIKNLKISGFIYFYVLFNGFQAAWRVQYRSKNYVGFVLWSVEVFTENNG